MSAGPPAKQGATPTPAISGPAQARPAKQSPAKASPTKANPAKASPALPGPAGLGTALRRSRLKAPRPLRLRLIDAVILAACGLLVLKLLAMAGPGPAGERSTFARVLADARAGYELVEPTTTGSVTGKEPEKPPEPAPPPQAQPPRPDPASPTERALLEKLGARRDALKQRSEELDQRERMLGEAERKLESGVGDLKQAEEKAEAGKGRDDSEKSGLKNIVTMYETMKPKDAARVFDRLGHEVLVPIVLAMNPRKMAEVLAVMQPESAERLTVALANRARGVAGPQAQTAAAGLPPNELPAIDGR